MFKVTRREIAKKQGKHILIDLNLNKRLKPMSLSKFERNNKPISVEKLANTISSSSSTYAIGSAEAGIDSDGEKVYYPHGDLGLFGTIYEGWKNHWVLRTSPDDWWFPVACRIAKAVDSAANNSKFPSSEKKVHDLFVSHDGKKNISIELPVWTVYEANYNQLFTAFSSELEQRIKVPKYTETMQNDFSTSSSAQTISSQINLMASMQEFFSYEMMCIGCGLRGLEMEGSVEDWEMLETKLKSLRKILKPIKNELGINDEWYEHTLDVFQNLAMTRKSPSDPKVAKWWINILCDTTGTTWVGGGGSMPGRPVKVKAYDGWLVQYLANKEKILAAELGLGTDLRKELSGFNQVQMKVSLPWCNLSDGSTLVAGVVGFKVHSNNKGKKEDRKKDCVPSVQSHHMWAMLLPPESPVRGQGPTIKSN